MIRLNLYGSDYFIDDLLKLMIEEQSWKTIIYVEFLYDEVFENKNAYSFG